MKGVRSFDETIKLFREKHGDKFTYYPETYSGSANKMKIHCNYCGCDFMQTPNKHLIGRGCPDCGGTRKHTLEEFMSKVEERFPNQFTVAEDTVYVNQRTDITIVCKKHGKITVNPKNFLTGCGCPKCKKERNDDKQRLFIEKAKQIHSENEELGYELVNYVNNHTPVKIVCHKRDEYGLEHGVFEQTPAHHLSGQGCPKCAGVEKHTLESFKKEVFKVHGDRFDLSGITEYNNNRDTVYPICHEKDENGIEHGAFKVTVHNLLGGRGCPKCKNKRISESETKTTEEYIAQAKNVHGDEYDYSEVVYKGAREYIYPICHKKDSNGVEHGKFRQEAYSHLRGCGCPKCAKSISQPEIEICYFIKTVLGCDVTTNERKIISGGKEIDIYVPSKKIAFEYDGMVWHSEKFGKDRNYHLNKTNECLAKGIKLFHIYESEYVEHKDIVLKKIATLLGKSRGIRLGARKCTVREIEKYEAREFLEKNHIQGFHSSTVYIGGYYKDELVGVMSFKKYSDNWELTRFATDNKYICQGLGGKLFKYFVRNYEFIEIKSFADRRWTVDEKDNLYVKLGFELMEILKPDYSYTTTTGCNIHKFNFRKKLLHRKYGLPLDMTESQMADKLKYYKIWNCGLMKFVYKNKTIK